MHNFEKNYKLVKYKNDILCSRRTLKSITRKNVKYYNKRITNFLRNNAKPLQSYPTTSQGGTTCVNILEVQTVVQMILLEVDPCLFAQSTTICISRFALVVQCSSEKCSHDSLPVSTQDVSPSSTENKGEYAYLITRALTEEDTRDFH